MPADLSSSPTNYAIFLALLLVDLSYSRPPTKSVRFSLALECRDDGAYNT